MLLSKPCACILYCKTYNSSVHVQWWLRCVQINIPQMSDVWYLINKLVTCKKKYKLSIQPQKACMQIVHNRILSKMLIVFESLLETLEVWDLETLDICVANIIQYLPSPPFNFFPPLIVHLLALRPTFKTHYLTARSCSSLSITFRSNHKWLASMAWWKTVMWMDCKLISSRDQQSVKRSEHNSE